MFRPTESQGRVHTSACTVAILPEVDVDTTVDINPADLRIDTYRASGAGGQHVNKTDSAVRITQHFSDGYCGGMSGRAFHSIKTKRKRWRCWHHVWKMPNVLQQMQQLQKCVVIWWVRVTVLSVFVPISYPQGRMTDHRINLTLYKLDAVMEGDLTELLDSLHREYQADQLAMLAQQNGG